MDHIHITASFISFGIIISIVVYLFNDNKRFTMINVFILILLYVSFLLIGVRLILIYLHIWLVLIFILGTKDMRIKIINFHVIIIIMFSVLCLFTFSFKSYFWSAIYLQYLPKQVLDYFEIYELVTKLAYQNDSIEALKNIDKTLFISFINDFSYMDLLFGTGFGEMNKKEGFLNDDLFFFQLFTSVGLLNSIIFIVMSLITLKNIIINLFLNKNIIILFGFFLVILLSISHSGVFIRKQVFPFFFFSIVMIDFYIKILINKYQK